MKPMAQGSGSFTLTEILAATAILSVMFTIMFSILQQTSKGWQAANRRVEASQVARLTMEQIATDLQNTFVFSGSNISLPGRTNTTNYSFGFFHTNVSDPSTSWWGGGTAASGVNTNLNSVPNTDAIFVASVYPPSVNRESPDLCEAGYILVYVVNGQGTVNMRGNRYFLLRHLPLRSLGTASGGAYRPTNDFFRTTNWYATPAGINVSDRNPILENCLHFDLKFISATNATPVVQWTNNSSLPLAVDITLAVVDEKTAERIFRIKGAAGLSATELAAIPDNLTSLSETDGLRRTLQEGLTVLRRRVYFKNAAR